MMRASGFWLLAVASAVPAGAQDPVPSAVQQFADICGLEGKGVDRLPGDDVVAAEAPTIFANDLQRATSSRVVRIGDRYVMRAVMPSSADPVSAIVVKCALTGKPLSYSEQVDGLSALLGGKPSTGTTAGNVDYAQFLSGASAFNVFDDGDGRVSIYRMDVMLRGIDPRYLKKGAEPAPLPKAE